MLDIEDFKKKLPKKSRLMGIDPGGKRIGIAISDENKIIATPYTTLIKNKYSDFADELINIVKENQIKGIIIGNPINMDGSLSRSSQAAKDLAINLSKDITENVTMWDERLSSQGAFNLSNDFGVNTSKKVDKLDQNSAQFILQGALDYLTKENT
ncbi:Holliday junction resolvase RuvX [Candidatus Pelagibacter bacterium]|jgi:putative Holliday junction resolvase|nr:Holliday junction resolvase RuvX [Candidatus Pelagibacter bacterium]MDA8772721.1 Holliday junction resolvase RuvX [Candidatus Pelagibacter bacterium]